MSNKIAFPRGWLVVFEGVEGCGKTTQMKRSHDWLMQGDWWVPSAASASPPSILATREPGGTELGQGIRQLLLDPTLPEPMQDRTELLLYAADRAQHVEGMLKPELAKGTLILCDRYTDSTVAYQGYGRGFSLDLIDQLNQMSTAGLQSDLTLWLDVDASIGLSRTHRRGVADRMEQNALEFHQRVQYGFGVIAKTNPHRVVQIDANRTEEEVFATVQATLRQYLKQWYGI